MRVFQIPKKVKKSFKKILIEAYNWLTIILLKTSNLLKFSYLLTQTFLQSYTFINQTCTVCLKLEVTFSKTINSAKKLRFRQTLL